jgi:tetratricopeptide (TPR) repeat protein
MQHPLSGNDSVGYCRVFLILLVLIFAIYGNSLQADWHLDDSVIILNNPRIKITEITSTALAQTFFASIDGGHYSSNKVYRPIPCLTFALNWYLGGKTPFGYHLVNISIHFLAGIFLFLSILWLYKTPRMVSRQAKDNSFSVAFFVAILWAVNPIQTQAVTYIVQRMASMAAMFYIIGIYLYLRGRLTESIRPKIGWFLGCLAAFLCALGSKENTITFPLAILLLEFMFFQDLTRANIRRTFVKIILLLSLTLLILGIWFFLQGDLSRIIGGYEYRSFTPAQRLMTEARIVVFYLSLLFYPAPTRLSIEHDVTVSTSLIHPWTTLPSILLIFALIILAIFQIRKRPILSFAILFFFLNHMVESTIVPLELIFEHRNYLPSLFLFVPLAVFIINLANTYKGKKDWIYASLVIFMILLVTGWGIGTRIRNMAWANEKTLWEDALRKAPLSARPYINLASNHYKKIGNYNKALELYQTSLLKKTHRSRDLKAAALHNIANIYYEQKKYPDAIRVWSQAVNLYPDREFLKYGLAIAYAENKNWDEADAQIDGLLHKNPDYPNYNFLKGSVLIGKGQLDAAISYFRSVLKKEPQSAKAWAKLGSIFYLQHDYRRAEKFLRLSAGSAKQDPEILLWLVAANMQLDDQKDVDYFAGLLLQKSSVDRVFSLLDKISDPDYHYLYQNKDKIVAVIHAKIEEKIQNSEAITMQKRQVMQ